MGEAGKDALRVGFDRAIRLEFRGARVSSDAGLFPYRDLAVGGIEHPHPDSRTAENAVLQEFRRI